MDTKIFCRAVFLIFCYQSPFILVLFQVDSTFRNIDYQAVLNKKYFTFLSFNVNA